MSRVSAKRIAVVIVAGLALVSALAVAALPAAASALSQTFGAQTLEWAVPLTAGLFVGLAAWALLDGSTPTTPGPSAAETTCPSCGRVVLRDWRLCPHCGAFITVDAEDPAYEAERG